MDGDVERVETIAIKMLKRGTNQTAEKDFMREVEIMSAFHHENVLGLSGFCQRGNFDYLPTRSIAA